MAEEKLVNPPLREFFEAVRDFVNGIGLLTGPLYFAALHQFEDQPSRDWTFLLGSRVLFGNTYDGSASVVREMDKRLPPRYRGWITKVGIVGPDDPYFRAVSRAVNVPPPPRLVEVQDCLFNGIHVRHACVFIASRNVAGRRQSLRKRTGERAGKKKRKPKGRAQRHA